MLQLLIGMLAIMPGVQVESQPQTKVAIVGELKPALLTEIAFEAYLTAREGIAFEGPSSVSSIMDDLIFDGRKTILTSGEDFKFNDIDSDDNDEDEHLLLSYSYQCNCLCNESECDNIALQAVLPQTFEYKLKEAEAESKKWILWPIEYVEGIASRKIPFVVVPTKPELKIMTRDSKIQ